MRRTVVPLVMAMLLAAVHVPAAPGPDIPIGDSPAFGPANAPVTIIEFIDFQ